MNLRIGLDIHGCIDTYPKKFSLLAECIIASGGEVHIVTGLKQDAEVEAQLEKYGVPYTHYFSIVDYLEESGVEVTWKENSSGTLLPYAPSEDWDVAKREYCKHMGIHFMLDDSPTYKDTFDDIYTTYLHVINPGREVYNVR